MKATAKQGIFYGKSSEGQTPKLRVKKMEKMKTSFVRKIHVSLKPIILGLALIYCFLNFGFSFDIQLDLIAIVKEFFNNINSVNGAGLEHYAKNEFQ